MPQVFSIGGYSVYFWSAENEPREPIHVHISKGKPGKKSSKFWLTKNGHAILADNKARLSTKTTAQFCRIIEARFDDIVKMWQGFFGEVKFYC